MDVTRDQLVAAIDEVDDMDADETLADMVLLELCETCWPTRFAQDS